MMSKLLRRLGACLFACLLLGTAVKTAAAQVTYTVKAGDTLYDIASAHSMTVEGLKALNGLTSDIIRVGQVLQLDDTEVLPDSVAIMVSDTALNIGRIRAYTVRPGETLYSIAADLGTKAYLLHALNGQLTAPLEAGQRLVVPTDTEERRVYAIGKADVFPNAYAGRVMTGGAAYDTGAFVVSHPELPMGSILLLENRDAGTATFAKVADRGPTEDELLMEISRAAANELALDSTTVVHVWLVE